jgi:hypothetical protein
MKRTLEDLPAFAALCNVYNMATRTIALTRLAYERLEKQKQPGESFSDVVLREIPIPCETQQAKSWIILNLTPFPAPIPNCAPRCLPDEGREPIVNPAARGERND